MVPIFRLRMMRNKVSHVRIYDVAQWEYDSTERQKEDGVGYDNEQMASEWSREYGYHGYKIRSVKARHK